MIAILAILTLARHKEKTFESGSRLTIFGQERVSGDYVSNALVATVLDG